MSPRLASSPVYRASTSTADGRNSSRHPVFESNAILRILSLPMTRLIRQIGFPLIVAMALLTTASYAATTSPLPFDPLSTSVLRQSPKKVFAHYFPPFPISMDNLSPSFDYYTTHYLNPSAENAAYQ